MSAKDFDIVRPIASGSSGKAFVVSSKSSSLTQLYVVKKIDLLESTSYAESEEEQAKFRELALNEPKILHKLNHANIVKVFDSCLFENTLNISMEYCSGGSLKKFLKTNRKSPCNETMIWSWLVQLASALAYLQNKNILHRDIKSENIFMCQENRIVKLGDFGVAKDTLLASLKPHLIVGTVTHRPPEAIAGEPLAFQSEVWALGVVFYEVMAGDLPFISSSQTAILNAIPRMTPQPIEGCLAEKYQANLRAKSHEDSDDGVMPIHVAANSGQLAVVEYLLERDFTLANIADGRGHEAIHKALLGGRFNIIEYFVKTLQPPRRVNVNVADKHFGRTLLHLAVELDNLEYCKMLVETYGADLRARSSPETDNAFLPIHLAAEFGNLKIVEYFMNRDSKLADEADSEGNLPIHIAALNNHIHIIEYFLQPRFAIDVNIPDKKRGRTLIHMAADHGHLDLAKCLLSKFGANLKSKSKDYGIMPIHLAGFFGHFPIVEFFTDNDGSLLLATDSHGRSILQFAIDAKKAGQEGSQAVHDWLIERGIKP